jgi:hypothetical protein
MKLGAPQNVGNFFTRWGIISSQGVTIVVILSKCKAPPWKFDTMVTKCLGSFTNLLHFFPFYRSLLWLYKNLTGVKWDYTAPSSG